MQQINSLTWAQYNTIVTDLASMIFIKSQEERIEFQFISGFPRGGLIPAVHLSHLLRIPYLANPRLVRIPMGETIRCLLVDDIFHTGETLFRFLSSIDSSRGLDCRFVSLLRNQAAPRKIVASMFPQIENLNLPDGWEASPWVVGREVEAETWIHFPWEIAPSKHSIKGLGPREQTLL